MKFYFITWIMIIFLSSCLKQSIPDAMLASKNSGRVTATLSYKINGNEVNITVADADNPPAGAYTLGCSKYPGYYAISGVSDNLGEFAFAFYTDSLTVGSYKYTGGGDIFFVNYNNTAEYLHAPSDSMSLNITSYSNGHISGNFSGVLTPLVNASTINNVFGASSSVSITNGSFKNVPVFY